MATTVNLALSAQHENEPGLSGAKTQSVNNVQHPDQIISAGTEEQTAMALFKDRQLQSLCMLSDQDVEVQFLGQRYAILLTAIVGPPGDTVTYTGNLEQEIFPGDIIRVEDTDTGDEGYYQIITVAEALGVTTITLADGETWPVGGAVVGTLARVASKQHIGYAYSLLASTGAGLLTVTGNLLDVFAEGDWLSIVGTAGNDGFYEITAVVTYAPNITSITVNDGFLVGLEGVVGTITKTRHSFILPAGESFLWDIEGGTQNPFIHAYNAYQPAIYEAFRGDVAFQMVNCAGAVNAQFDARIALNPDIF